MHELPTQDPSPDFLDCLYAAGEHLDRQVQGGIGHWLKATPTPPFLEHLSFRIGDQLFFVRLEDTDGEVEMPGHPEGLMTIAAGCNGHACRLPMRRTRDGWQPVEPGWGLLDVGTGRAIDPFRWVTDARVEMTPWEIQDFAVQVVRDRLESDGYEVLSSQGNPSVDPSLWFIGDSGGPEWVVVRAAAFPAARAAPPSNLAAIATACARGARAGHFASVAMVCVDALFEEGDDTDPDEADADDTDPDQTSRAEMPPLPLWRGHGMDVAFEGLERVWG